MFSLALCFMIPGLVILVSSILAIRAVRKGADKKRAVIAQIGSAVCAMLLCLVIPQFSSSAKESDTQTAVTSSQSSTEDSKGAASIAFSVGLLAAALATGLSGLGGGIAVASAAPAAIAATSEDPKAFGKALIFVALGEGIAIYGLLVSILIISKIDQLKI